MNAKRTAKKSAKRSRRRITPKLKNIENPVDYEAVALSYIGGFWRHASNVVCG